MGLLTDNQLHHPSYDLMGRKILMKIYICVGGGISASGEKWRGVETKVGEMLGGC